MKQVIVWYNPNKNIYYHRIINLYSYYERYPYIVGSVNSYGHIIVDIIPFEQYIIKVPYRKKIIRKTISLLKSLERG